MTRVQRSPLIQARVPAPSCGAERAGRGRVGGGGGGSRCCSLARRAHCGSGDLRAPQAAFPVARNLGHCLDRVRLGRLTLGGSRWSPES